MNTKRIALLLALAGYISGSPPASAQERDFKSDYFKAQEFREGMPPPEPNLAVDLDAPGAVRAELRVAAPGLEQELIYGLEVDSGEISGGIFVPVGEARLTVTAFDAFGEPVYKGERDVVVDEKLTPQFDLPLEGGNKGAQPHVRLGSYLLGAAVLPQEKDGSMLRLTLFDPRGSPVEFNPDDLYFELPEGFPTLPYSCFNGALCILEWKPTPEMQLKHFCLKNPFSCVIPPPPDRRGPYKYVAAGRNHTCALTWTNEIRCWGDNFAGQLGAPSSTPCGSGFGGTCGLSPQPVVCPANASCRFTSLAAGGDHTCAVDTNGKAWCWGEDGTEATGVSSFGSLPNHTHREVPARTDFGAVVSFTAIDTNIAHTCALSTAQDLYCWGSNSAGQLGTPTAFLTNTARATFVRSGNKYRSIAAGTVHSCAMQINGLADCWGDNLNFQLTGNTNTSTFVTVNPLVPMLTGKSVLRIAAGESSTCAQNSDDNTICWGKPSISSAASTRRQNFVALFASSATSLATETDDCGGSSMNCTQTCLTESTGELQCGRWFGTSTPQLSRVTDPRDPFPISWTQVDVGPNHACAVTTERDVWCFGKNDRGQFGTGVIHSADTFGPTFKAARVP